MKTIENNYERLQFMANHTDEELWYVAIYDTTKQTYRNTIKHKVNFFDANAIWINFEAKKSDDEIHLIYEKDIASEGILIKVKTFDLYREVEEFNDMKPQDAIDYLSNYLMTIDCDDERCSDAIKRLQMFINESLNQ